MSVLKLSQIVPAGSPPALTDQIVGVTGGTTNNLYSLSQLISTLAGTAYYVSPTGNNSNNGQSPATAWQTIAKVNASTFQPGDGVLFQGGQTFSGAIVSPSAGTPASPITFGSYGGGQATISSGTSNGFTSTDQSGIIVRDLIFTGSASTNRGIFFNISSTALPQNIQIINCSVSGYGWSGIQVYSNSAGVYSDVFIEGNTSNNCCSVTTGGVGSAGIWVNFGHVNVRAIGNVSSNHAGATDTINTGNGLKFSGVVGGAITNNIVFSNGGSCSVVPATGGPGGIVCIYSTDVYITDNDSYSNSTATSLGGGVLQDGNGIDIDGGCTNCHAIGNRTNGNYGAGIAGIQFAGAGTFNGNSFRNNTSTNDGVGGALSNIPYSFYLATSGAAATNTTVSGNTFYQSNANAGVIGLSTDGNTLSGLITGSAFIISGAQKFVNTASNPAVSINGNRYLSAGAFAVTWNSVGYTTLGAWQTATGQETNSVPSYETILIPAAGNGLTLKASNPALNLQDTETNGDTWQWFVSVNGSTSYWGVYTFNAPDQVPLAINLDGHHSAQIQSGAVYGWSSNARYANVNAMDTGISRLGAAKIAFGNGTQGDISAEIDAAGAHFITAAAIESLIVDNNAHPSQFSVRGTTDGNQFANFDLTELSTNKQWNFSHRDDHSFLIYWFDGVSTFVTAMHIANTGAVQFPTYTTAGVLQNDTSGNITSLAGFTGTITTAKLTPATGANGSMTFVKGILTAQTQAT